MQPTVKPVFLALAILAFSIPNVYAEDEAESQESSPRPKHVTEQLVDTLTKLSGGPHAGFRSNHAKGLVVTGEFTPSPSAASITKAAHMQSATVPVIARYSNAGGVPTIADADGHAFPKGMAIRFELPDGGITDIVAISVNSFPAATPEEFLGLLNAIAASGPDAAKPSPVEVFLGSHPAAMRFVSIPKLPPESFATQPFFGVNAFKFTNAQGQTHFGRYRIEPLAGERFLSKDESAKATPNYLMNELPARLKDGAVKYRISVQVAEEGDAIIDATQSWPESRKVVELGTLIINAADPNSAKFEKTVMFNPLTLTDGIEATNDPILQARPGAYAVSFGRRLSGN